MLLLQMAYVNATHCRTLSLWQIAADQNNCSCFILRYDLSEYLLLNQSRMFFFRDMSGEPGTQAQHFPVLLDQTRLF